jgi:hypothetical protein
MCKGWRTLIFLVSYLAYNQIWLKYSCEWWPTSATSQNWLKKKEKKDKGHHQNNMIIWEGFNTSFFSHTKMPIHYCQISFPWCPWCPLCVCMHTCTYSLGWNNSLVRSYKYWVVFQKAKELELVQQQQQSFPCVEGASGYMVHESFHMPNSHSLALYSTSAPQFIHDTLFSKPTTILKFFKPSN